jgi:hypothetical protein
MTQDMQVRNLSRHTQASYLQQGSLFARHFGKSPDALTPEHIRTYQIYLTNEKKLADVCFRQQAPLALQKDWVKARQQPRSR